MPKPSPALSGAFTAAHGDFDRVAWFYDGLAAVVFGPALRRAQQAALAGLPPGAPRVLILGGGSGWVLGEVLQRRPQAGILYLEASGAMLQRAQAWLLARYPERAAQVGFRHGTEAALQADETFDAVITFFVLDCMPLAAFAPALARLDAALRSGGHWLVADFNPPRRWWQRGLLQAMYWFFQASAGLQARELPPYQPALRALGMRQISGSSFFGEMVAALVYQKAG